MIRTDIKMFMHCRQCGGGHHSVGVTASGQLVVWCDECDTPVVALVQWPDPRFAGNIKCHACGGDCGCGSEKKEDVN